MTIEHSVIADPNIHEPKGVSTATINQVYVADGLGSGAWGSTPPSSINVVQVNSASDFPAAVAGVITLADNTTYILANGVNIGTDRLVLGDNTGLKGTNRFVDSLTYTGSGIMITADETHLLEELFFSATSGTLFSMTASTPQTALITNCFASCANVGTYASSSEAITTVWRSFSVISATGTGLLTTGSHRAFNTSNSLWSGFTSGNTMIDFGTATFDRVQIVGGNRFVTDTGITAINLAASSANINSDGRGFLSDSIFEGAGTALANGDPSDILWNYDASGIPRSEKAVDIYMQSNATGTSASTTPTLIAGTWTEESAQQFTCTAAGRCTYTGVDPTGFDIHCNIHASATSGSSQTYFFYVYVNGSVQQASRAKREFTTSTPGNVSIVSHVELETNDYFEIFVEKETGSDTITCDDVHIVTTAVN